MKHKNELLNKIKENFDANQKKVSHRIVICAGTGCIASGSLEVFEEFKKQIAAANLNLVVDLNEEAAHDNDNIHLSGSGCQGFCAMGPLVNLVDQKILYVKVKPEDVAEIIRETILQNKVIDRLIYEHPVTGEHCKGQDDIPFYNRQTRIVLEECGIIDPESIEEYIAEGGYSGAYRSFTELTPEQNCQIIEDSGLRGRGGGGFPTGKKWKFALSEPNEKKYIICNGDEGDPGAFMDRSLMEGNPHRVVEGMMIAARAIGADEAYVYVRLEYPLAVDRMISAINDAEKIGVLGDNVLGTGKKLKMHVMEGAGAFVCGEETALISSIEGKRGMPTPKPPFPAKSGLWGKPTIINNVETLATVPLILRNSVSWYKEHGTGTSTGTKTFALTGHVANTGLIEVPFGTTLREIVYNIGGGVTDDDGNITNKGFKAVQIGGPSGGCLTEAELDMPLDYEHLAGVGAMVGSGGLVVMNKQSCMVQIARFFMEFTQNESCGKCVPCREGTKQLLGMLDDIIAGNGTMKTLEMLEETGSVVKVASLCGLGKTAPSPVLSTINLFRDEYLAHIVDKSCPTNNCKALANITISEENCIGCTACARKCPVNAITGNKKELHFIDASICTKCGICDSVCKFNAILGF